MVSEVFKHIGRKIQVANPWIQSYSVNCIQLPSGRVVNLFGYEKTDCGIDDTKGTGFYIRILPKFTYTPQRALSSNTKENKVSVPFKLVFFEIEAEKERHPLIVENILSTNLRQMSFTDYSGIERQLSIIITSSNSDFNAVYKEETTKKFESGVQATLVSLEGRLEFLSTDENCESDCFPYPTYTDILQTFDFCDPKILGRLTAYQVQCLEYQYGNTMQYRKLTYTGAIDGINTVFVAEEEPVQVVGNGVVLTLGVDYTQVGNTITFIVAPFLDVLTPYILSIYGNKNV